MRVRNDSHARTPVPGANHRNDVEQSLCKTKFARRAAAERCKIRKAAQSVRRASGIGPRNRLEDSARAVLDGAGMKNNARTSEPTGRRSRERGGPRRRYGIPSLVLASLALACCLPPPPATPERFCEDYLRVPCLSHRECVADARGCYVCRCTAPPFVPFDRYGPPGTIEVKVEPSATPQSSVATER
jgi:hypothetical protein